MAKFEPKKYPDFKNVVEEAFYTMYMTGGEIYRFPIVLAALIVEDYEIDQDDENIALVYDYLERFCAKYFSKRCEMHMDKEFSWKDLPGIKLFIWRECLKLYNDDMSKAEVIKTVCHKLIKKLPNSEVFIWLGAYVAECVEVISTSRPTMQLDFHMYAGNRFNYRGLIKNDSDWWFSSDGRGIVDEDRVVEYYVPGTVCQLTDLYDDVRWDELTETEQLSIISKYNIPPTLEPYIAEVWRGHPIYTGDVVEISVMDKDQIVETAYATYITEENDDVMLVFLDPSIKSFSDKKMENSIFKIVGNIYTNEEYSHMYETVLTQELFSN